MNTHNPRSTAKVAGHPLHPMVIPFPIAFFVSTLVTDLIYLNTHRPGFAEASMWLLGAGLASALLAAVLGLTDFLGDRRVRRLRQAWLHMVGNVILVALQAVNFYLRSAGDIRDAIAPSGVTLSAIAVALLLFNGWMGWEMVYRGHVGVVDETETASIR
ncbi:MAG TPA: DUF2231 domain-containing protein [Phenylobacterium sp.]|uniref:DUF2231 domain-containing protein n=1 Tax=Phenylobacterium sp. TaxID=1871053 RepID=UPI002B48B840|nr:DUF2231 domain-containing protein [Phenylobacterium sp.]HKR87289.1 DUF2231 domain-containing protein [Phenylobacterium sp.]